MSEYQKQALDFLSQFNLTLEIVKVPRDQWEAPIWDNDGVTVDTNAMYEFTIRSDSGAELSDKFWDSRINTENGKSPTEYDILACLSPYGETDPDEVYEVFGEMKPSQCLAIADQNMRVDEFFTCEEKEALGEIS